MLVVTTAPTNTDLVDITTVQRELQLDQDDLVGVAEMITDASHACATYCGRHDDAGHEFAAATVQQTERLRAPALKIMLDRDINPAIVSVVEDGTTLDSADYELDRGFLYRLSDDSRTWWPAAKIIITYTTGYALPDGAPGGLRKACLAVLAHWIAGRGRDPMLRSERVEGVITESYRDPSSDAAGLPEQATGLLRGWLREF